MANENVTTNIVVNSNFSSLIGDLNKASAALMNFRDKLSVTNKALAQQVAVINRTFADTMRSTGQFSTHFVSLSSDVDKFGSQLDKGQIKLNQFFRVFNDHTKGSGGLIRQLAQQQVQLQNAILQPLGRNAEGLMQYNVHIPRGLDLVKNRTALAKQELQIMNKVIQQGANQLINWGKNTQWAGRQLTVGLTVPLAAFGKAAADAFAKADQELTRLTKVYGGVAATSAAELKKIRNEVAATAADLSKSYGASFQDTIALASDIAATGKQGNELLNSVRETTRLAVLGEVDRQDAMKATLAIQTAFKQNTKELGESINFLNAVENQTSTTLADLVEAIPKAGPVIQGLGGDVKDLALYLTAMREGGISASEGANALKSGLASLINPTKVATGMFQSFGIDLKGIVEKNAGNVTNTILELQGALDKLDPLQKQKALEQLFGKFQFARMNALFSNLGKQGSQTLQVLDLMKASSQDLASIAGRELSQVTESASGKYRRALEGLKADLAGVGNQFLTINTALINIVDKVIEFANHLPKPIKQLLSVLGMFTAAAGPLIMLTGVLGNFVGYVVKGIFHLRSLFKGGEGWKLLTPEILAANQAGSLAEQTFYSDAKAANVFNQAVQGLIGSLSVLETKLNSGIMQVIPQVTNQGMMMQTQGFSSEREVNPQHPMLSAVDTRSMSHMNPVAGMSPEERQAQTLFGVVPGAPKVNHRIGANPQVYMSGEPLSYKGLTNIRGVSTGVVAQEAAKWHAMTAALAMQSKAEITKLKTEVATTGLVTDELSSAYQALLPKMNELVMNAADEAAKIVESVRVGKMTADQARAELIALNSRIEQLMVQTSVNVASDLGRTIDVTKVPLLDQPVVDPNTGKSNMKELTKPGRTRNLVNKIAGALGVKTYGAGYSMETTRPKRLNDGGIVYDPAKDGPIIPGPAHIDYDMVPGQLEQGGYVLNKQASKDNPEIVKMAKPYNSGGKVNAILTPGETYFGPAQARTMYPLLEAANNGELGGKVIGSRNNYGKINLIQFGQLARAFISNKSGFAVAERQKVLAASNSLTGKNKRSWPNGVERAHMVEPIAVTVGGKDYAYHPGVMFMQSRLLNQATKSSGPGATGSEIANDFNKLVSSGFHPASLMLSNANNLGYSNAQTSIERAYEEVLAVLNSPKYRSKVLGGKRNKITLESIVGPILRKHLRKLKIKGGRNFFNDLYYQGGIRGKTGKTEDVVNLEGYALGGLVGKLKGFLYKGPNALYQLMNYMKARKLIKNKMYHGSAAKGYRGEEYLQGNEVIDTAASRDKFYGMGFYSTSSKSEADLYASGYNTSTNGTSFGSINEITKIPFERYIDFRKPLKWQSYALWKELQKITKENDYKYFDEELGPIMRKLGLNGSIMPQIGAGWQPKSNEATWLSWANPNGIHTKELALGGPVSGRKNSYGKISPKLSQAVIDRLTANWPKKEKGWPLAKSYWTTNDDPLHGPLMIGRSRHLASGLKGRVSNDPFALTDEISYDRSRIYPNTPSSFGWVEAFPVGNEKRRALYALRQAMEGNYGPISDSRIKHAINALRSKFTGKLFRGINLDKDQSLPPHVIQAILAARASGDMKSLVGLQFLMNRTSWSEAEGVAKGFGRKIKALSTYHNYPDLLIEARIKNRNTIPMSGLFPNAKFNTSTKTTTGWGDGAEHVSEQEHLVGGPFKVVWAGNRKIIVEAREKGGDVERGKPYLVGEKGPELFVPGNSGAIVPRYKFGGFVGSTLAGLAGSMVGQNIGQNLGGDMGGTIGNMLGWMIPGMFMGSGLRRRSGESSDLATDDFNRISKAYDKSAIPVTKWKDSLAKAAFTGGKLNSTLAKMALGISKTNVALAAGTAIAITAYKAWDNAAKARTASQDAIRINKEDAVQLGIVYKSAVGNIKATTDAIFEQRKLLEAKAAGAAGVGGGVNLTVKQLKELQKEVKSTSPDIIQLFNNLKDEDVVKNVSDLKAQMVAGGISAQEATNKIYALLSLSNKAKLTTAALGTGDFKGIYDQRTAAKYSISTTAKALSNKTDAKELVNTFDQGLNSIEAYYSSISKVKNATGKWVFDNQAVAKTIKEIELSEGGRKKIGEANLRVLLQQKPELNNILSSSDNIASAWAKYKLYTAGVAGDLSRISGAQAQGMLQVVESIKNVATSLTTKDLSAKNPFVQLVNLGIKAKAAAKAAQTAADNASKNAQKNADAEMKKIDLKIAKINEEYDARRKLIEYQSGKESYNLSIQKEQLNYQNKIASGDLEGAAIAQINLKQLNVEYQKQQALAALEEKRNADLKKADKERQAMQDKLNKAQENAAKLAAAAAKAQEKANSIAILQQSIANTMAQAAIASPAQLKVLAKSFESDLNALAKIAPDVAKSIPVDTTTRLQELPLGKSTTITTKDYEKTLKGLTQGKGAVVWDEASKLAMTNFGLTLDKFNSFWAELLGLPDVKKAADKALAARPHGKGYAKGGLIRGKGTTTSDSIPIMASDKEFMFSASAVNGLGGPKKVNQIHAMASSGINPFAVGMEWFGKTLTNALHSVTKIATGFDPLKPFSSQSNLEKLSMAAMLLPGGGLAKSAGLSAKLAGLSAKEVSAHMAAVDKLALEKIGKHANQGWEEIQKMRVSELVKKYPKLDTTDVKKFNELYAKEFYGLSADQSIAIFKGDVANAAFAKSNWDSSKTAYFSRIPDVAAAYSDILRVAKSSADTGGNILSSSIKIKNLDNILGEGIGIGAAQGMGEFPIKMTPNNFTEIMSNLVSHSQDEFAALQGFSATGNKMGKYLLDPILGYAKAFGFDKFVGKMHSWNGVVPGPYGQEVSAILKAGTEGIYQESYIKSLKNQSSGDTIINISPTINPAPGMDENMLADLASRKAFNMLKDAGYMDSRSIGSSKVVGRR